MAHHSLSLPIGTLPSTQQRKRDDRERQGMEEGLKTPGVSGKNKKGSNNGARYVFLLIYSN
jgi:hypothetical protein